MNTDRFRELLLDEHRRVSQALDYLHSENAGSQDDEVPETGIADTGTVTLDRELDYSLEENSSRMLEEIEAALRRLDEGTFGTCERCGNPIAEERLEAMPYATKCIDCKRLEERG